MRILAVILGEAAELVADHEQRFVAQRRLAEIAVGDQRCETRPRRRRIAAAQPFLLRAQRRQIGLGQTQITRPHDLALAHRQTAQDLRQVFGEADLQNE